MKKIQLLVFLLVLTLASTGAAQPVVMRNDAAAPLPAANLTSSSMSVDQAGRTITSPLSGHTSATGNIDMLSTSSAVTIDSKGLNTVGFQLAGTWTGSIIIEGTVDDTTWTALERRVPAATATSEQFVNITYR